VTKSDAPSWQLRDSERIIIGNAELLAQKHFLIGITRVRNEALILRDSLDFVGQHVDAIVAYDDASTDQTLDVFRSHPKVALIVANGSWEADVKARKTAEHRHRQLLLQTARARLQFDWVFCFDPDDASPVTCVASPVGRTPRIATPHAFSCSTLTSPLMIARPIGPARSFSTSVGSSAPSGVTS
jgi:hypothetical protein